MKTKTVFLDRDGIIIEDTGFPGAIGDIIFFPNVAEAINLLNKSGYLVIVITNQSAVARGLTDKKGVDRINECISKNLLSKGAIINAFYYCPHHPQGSVMEYAIECECRKPKPGLIIRAVEDFGIDAKKSFFIGDSARDIEAAKAAGTMPILISKNHNDTRLETPSFANLLEAVNYILEKDDKKI